jgi:hypothetical protein
MNNLFASLIITTFMFSCKTQKTITMINNGFYIGKLNKDLIFNYIVIINLKDSTSTLNAYVEEKGMVTAYNIFNNKKILPNSECFQFNKGEQDYTLLNTSNKIRIIFKKGSLVMESPLRLKLKYYKEEPISLSPSKKYALYCYCWLYPHIILGINNELDALCKSYIQNRMQIGWKNIGESLSYENYFALLKDSISLYKQNYDKTLVRQRL